MLVTGIILLAGNSTRYNKGFNKNLELLNNQYVFLYSLNVFLKNKYINDIILVVRDIDKKEIENILSKIELSKEVKLIIGGNTRMDSVYNALISTDSEIVVIHDAARPFIKDEYINNGIKYMSNYFGAVTCVKAKDTIKISDNYKEIKESTNRENTFLAQTPQIFNRNILLKLHKKYKNNISITDDSMILEKEKYPIRIIDGDYTNIKITTIDDLDLAKVIIKKL